MLEIIQRAVESVTSCLTAREIARSPREVRRLVARQIEACLRNAGVSATVALDEIQFLS